MSFEGGERCVGGLHLSEVITFSLSVVVENTRALCSVRVKLSQ